MAKRTNPRQPIKEVTTRYVPPPEDDEDDKPEIFDAAEETYSQFLQKFGTEGVLVKVYRQTQRGTQYCFHGTPSEIDEETVRVYHAKQTYAHEEGQYFARCFVRGEPRDSFPINIAPQVGATVEHGGMAQGGANSEMLRMMERLVDKLEARTQQQEPLSSLADAMVKIQQMTKPPDLPIDVIMKAVELGKTISSNGSGGESEWTPIIKEALTHAGPILGGLLGGLARGVPGRVPAAIPSGAIQTNPNGEGGNMPENPQAEAAQLALAVGYLKRKCIAGSNPELYIHVILDNAEEETYQRLIRKIATEEFSAFAAIDPEIGKPPFLAFFKYIYDGLRSALAEADKVVSASGGTGGDGGDAPKNVTPRKGGAKKS